MKRVVLWFMSTLTVLVLLFGYHTSTSSRAASANSSAIAPISGGSAGTAPATSGSSSAAGTPGSSAGSTSAGSSTAASDASSSDPGSSASSATTSTVTGSVAQTRWGPVQVQITVTGGQITDVSVVQYPDENDKDAQINARALPVLIKETLAAQSDRIDMVSGATVTSEGYLTSLQSALDQAGL